MSIEPRRRLRILTWHVHGNYLYYLSQVPHDFYLVADEDRTPHHTGRSGRLPWGDNVKDAPVERIRDMAFDLVLYQSRDAYEREQTTLLSSAQQRLPIVYLEHDPPQDHPVDTRHWANDEKVMLVHVTHFNALMWQAGDCRVRVVEHGVTLLSDARYEGRRDEGIVVVNNLDRRGRRLGADIFQAVRSKVPLRLVGMGAERLQGDGEVPNEHLPALMAQHRFFFNPIRYTSLGLSVVEAMLVGLPIIGLATTELPTVIRNGVNGHVDTRVDRLVDVMRMLIAEPDVARAWGAAARETALARFGIQRFIDDWLDVFEEATRSA
jgi:glycosyltransferase involved in cell wall biosynthesis